ncbi:MAG: hypothetical protein L0154_28375 [Chloroflexi bacterium]|nr:hypothetical protein [Chloroflexota bacterium]
MSVVKQREYKRKTNPYLPVIGLLLAVIFGVIAYFVAPSLVDILVENFSSIESRLQEENGERNITIAAAVAIWLVLMSVYVILITIASGGTSYFEDEQQILQPRSNDPKEIKAYYSKREKMLKKKKKLIKELAAEEKRQQRRR